MNLPTLIIGTEAMEPGEWANFIMTPPFKFSIAFRGARLRRNILPRLLAMKCINEPVIRPGQRTIWDAGSFYTRLNTKLANIESAVIQCVGPIIEDPDEMCENCKKRNGPFPFCVRVDGVPNCGNCHWMGQSRRCSFNTGQPCNTGQPAPKIRRNGHLITREESEQITGEIAELKVVHREILKQLASHDVALENASDHYREALFVNPMRNDPPLPQALEEYHLWLAHKWMRDGFEASLETRSEFRHLADKVTKTMARIIALSE
ncbi:hypothetical protein N7454_005410 [Penicillium verhagenii]|nr:hypothetical protein N7454_005410 [Penicillium verhagenii]